MDHEARYRAWHIRVAAMTAVVGLATLAGCGKHDLKLLGLRAACKAGVMKACNQHRSVVGH